MRPTPFLPFVREELDQSIPHRFRRQAALYPARLAIHSSTHSWTYEELDRISSRVARSLLDRLGDGAEPVGIVMPQGAPLLAAILGVLKAGKFYVPLDLSFPSAYLESIFAETGVRLVITGAEFDALAANPSSDDPALEVAPDSLAYIYFTSGSTGRPKGVCDTHRNVLHNIMRYTNSLEITAADRLTLLQGPAFSGAVSSMFGALLNGATVLPYDLRSMGMGRPLASWLAGEEITIYHSVPMIFRSAMVGGARYPSIRTIRLEGDAASKTDVALFRSRFGPHCRLVNGLGTTETGIASQFFMTTDTPLEGGAIPVGYATADMRLMILDEARHEVPRGVVGEIAVQSAYLAKGYWQQPELTRSRFLPGPDGERIYRTGDLGSMREDGCLDYLGRKDNYPKIRGQRVEPAEVERALLRLDGVQDAAVTIGNDKTGSAHLIAWLVPAGSPPAQLDEPMLRATLADAVPEVMIPTRFIRLDRFPLSDNGKIDRQALVEPVHADPASTAGHVPARNALEAKLVELWEELLDRRPIGVTDNFFALGGDSLRAAALLTALEEVTDRDLPPSSLVEAPTIELLARHIQEDRAQSTALVPIQPGGVRPPFFMVHGHRGFVGTFGDLPAALGGEQPFYGLQSIGWWADRPPYRSIEEMAGRYIEEMRRVQPAGPYRFGGDCYGSVVASEMAHQLRAQGETISLLFFMYNTPADFPGLVPGAVLRRFQRHALVDRLRGTAAAQRLAWHAGQIRGHSWGGRTRYALQLATRIIARSARPGVADAGPNPARSRPHSGRPDVSELNLRAQRAYRPKPLPMPVTLILRGEDRSRYSAHPEGDWGKVAAGYDIHFVPWQEGLIFREPRVQVLAEILRSALRGETEARAPQVPARP